MKPILLALILSFFLSSCKKEEIVLSSGQQVAARIQADMRRTGASGSIVYIGTNYTNDPSPITFDGDFMIIGNEHYNLNRLIEYELVYDSSNPKQPFFKF